MLHQTVCPGFYCHCGMGTYPTFHSWELALISPHQVLTHKQTHQSWELSPSGTSLLTTSAPEELW